ncbi:PaaX family transcriptional regulator C-terminal domain-containing protein [Nocardia stercoris]|uniref:PaaX domain-containing protein, C-domain protein n=1 Tax=Nocardia stercoris TaxID=2483361 RepID=A0A3M2KW53_9NOCA|nr:PaaX family transcriptional regulator C-terminal domain-containing protein [Nocardia stercoris]RMI29709.1 PaaX domain-containing protein, C- domain protein [Nocardia stercoris]
MSARTPARRLTARSAILSALLGAHPAEAPVSGIVAVCVAMGLHESTVRAALTRMVAAGDLERADSIYRLSPRLIDRQQRQDDAQHPQRKHWDGSWRIAVVTTGADDPAARIALRETLQRMRFGELREGVWTRPDNLWPTGSGPGHERLTFFSGRPEESETDLAERLFRVRSWSARAQRLLAALADAEPMAARFEIAAACVRTILDDPVLPPELLPDPWPGAELRAAYSDFRAEFAAFAYELIGDRSSTG